MRITSPKAIPFSPQKSFFFDNQLDPLTSSQHISNNKSSLYTFQSKKNGTKDLCNEEYGFSVKNSFNPSTTPSLSTRSKSKNGISLSRGKAIRLDSIYESHHFLKSGQSTQNSSTRSISSKDLKSVSKLTQASSPSIPPPSNLKTGQLSKKTVEDSNKIFDFKELIQKVDEQWSEGWASKMGQNSLTIAEPTSKSFLPNNLVFSNSFSSNQAFKMISQKDRNKFKTGHFSPFDFDYAHSSKKIQQKLPQPQSSSIGSISLRLGIISKKWDVKN